MTCFPINTIIILFINQFQKEDEIVKTSINSRTVETTYALRPKLRKSSHKKHIGSVST